MTTRAAGLSSRASMHSKGHPLAARSPGRDFCAPVDVLPPGAGVRFAALMQRSWCARRTVNPGVLVLSMLHDEARRQLLDAWRNAGAGPSSFFAAEADVLLEFIAAQLPDASPELSICRLEQLTLRANDGAGAFQPPLPASFGPQRLVRRGSHAGLVFFHGESNPVLRALLSSAPRSTTSRRVTALLVAPGSEPLCRAASPHEQELWVRLGEPAPAATLMQGGAAREVIESMLHIGALEYV
jgi:hypothetical protein